MRLSISLSLCFVNRMNAQLRPILDLLREVENINLASEVLEPEPRSIHQVLYWSCAVRPMPVAVCFHVLEKMFSLCLSASSVSRGGDSQTRRKAQGAKLGHQTNVRYVPAHTCTCMHEFCWYTSFICTCVCIAECTCMARENVVTSLLWCTHVFDVHVLVCFFIVS